MAILECSDCGSQYDAAELADEPNGGIGAQCGATLKDPDHDDALIACDGELSLLVEPHDGKDAIARR